MRLNAEHDRTINAFGRYVMAFAGGVFILTGVTWFKVFLFLAVITGYWFGGLLLVPDLDRWQTCQVRWGVFAFLWQQYAKDYRPHGWDWRLSHWPVVGTIGRLLVLMSWLSLAGFAVFAVYYFGYAPDPLTAIANGLITLNKIFIQPWPLWTAAVGGIELSALVHLYKDLESSSLPQTSRTRSRLSL